MVTNRSCLIHSHLFFLYRKKKYKTSVCAMCKHLFEVPLFASFDWNYLYLSLRFNHHSHIFCCCCCSSSFLHHHFRLLCDVVYFLIVICHVHFVLCGRYSSSYLFCVFFFSFLFFITNRERLCSAIKWHTCNICSLLALLFLILYSFFFVHVSCLFSIHHRCLWRCRGFWCYYSC